MSRRCSCEYEDLYFKEKIVTPHCECRSSARNECRESMLEIRREVTNPRHDVHRSNLRVTCSTQYLPEMIDSDTDYNLCLCYQCRKLLGRSEATVRRDGRAKFSDHKCSLLKSWFSRFDSDEDGYLDIQNLEELLKHLGATAGNSYTEKILKTCDRDSDGRLSFSEFMHLWHRASTPDEDFLVDNGCRDLSPIVKKYELNRETRSCTCNEYHCKHVTAARKHSVQSVTCTCGQKENVLLFEKQEMRMPGQRPPKDENIPSDKPPKKDKKDKNDKNPSDKTPKNDNISNDRLPTMSMNRDKAI